MPRSLEVSLGDRIVTSILATVLAAVTCVLVPIAVAVHGGGAPFGRLWFHSAFWIWAAVVSASACVTGFLLGSERAASMFGHLWGTEVPAQPRMTVSLWLVLLGIASGTYYVVR